MEESKNTDMEDQARMMAASEKSDSGDDIPKISFTVKFKPPHMFEGEKYDELDLSKLQELTTKDAEYFDSIMAAMRHFPTDKFRDTKYLKQVAVRVTGKPVEFFNTMSMRNFEEVKSRISMYFLFG
ncbi:MAG: hypothetical protein J5966_07660 [Lachnospiraceae bacterium]|nr:hypothetical protein [Lachnospiraceae bacterium]